MSAFTLKATYTVVSVNLHQGTVKFESIIEVNNKRERERSLLMETTNNERTKKRVYESTKETWIHFCARRFSTKQKSIFLEIRRRVMKGGWRADQKRYTFSIKTKKERGQPYLPASINGLLDSWRFCSTCRRGEVLLLNFLDTEWFKNSSEKVVVGTYIKIIT